MSRIGQVRGTALWGLLLTLYAAGSLVAQRSELIGRVVVAGTSEPVVAALVVLVGSRHEGVTDNSGVFRIRDVAPGKYRLQVQHIGYSRQTVEVEVRSDEIGRAHV